MRTRVMCVCLAIGLATNYAESQDPNEMAEMIKAMKEKYGKLLSPGPQHEQLGKLIGKWNVKAQMGMPADGAPAVKATAEYKWVIPGRFVSNEIKGSMMGTPFHGFTLIGFDNVKKKWTSVSVNDMNTSMTAASGTIVDPTGKLQVSYGTLDEYMTGEHDKAFKVVTRIKSDDEHVIEVWDLGVGETGMKVLQYTYTRQKQ